MKDVLKFREERVVSFEASNIFSCCEFPEAYKRNLSKHNKYLKLFLIEMRKLHKCIPWYKLIFIDYNANKTKTILSKILEIPSVKGVWKFLEEKVVSFKASNICSSCKFPEGYKRNVSEYNRYLKMLLIETRKLLNCILDYKLISID